MILNIDISEDFVNIANNGSNVGSIEALKDINKEIIQINARRHIFSVIHLSEVLQEKVEKFNLIDEYVSNMSFESAFDKDNREIIKFSVSPVSEDYLDMCMKFSKSFNNDLYLLEEPNYFFFSEKLNEAISESGFYIFKPKICDLSKDFIDICLNDQFKKLVGKEYLNLELKNSNYTNNSSKFKI